FFFQAEDGIRDSSPSRGLGDVGLIPLLLIGISLEGNPFHFHWTRMAFLALFYLSIVGSVVAFLLYYWLVQHMDVTKTMLIALVTPVIALTLGVLVLHEELNWRTFAGGAMIISGIGLIVAKKVAKRDAEFVSTG
ncbi:MAG TPA: hypothetical protein DCK99_11005, partial [Blastocatellia bacterium]|nr:hypothetical protein [Blastocatellia bacterium]